MERDWMRGWRNGRWRRAVGHCVVVVVFLAVWSPGEIVRRSKPPGVRESGVGTGAVEVSMRNAVWNLAQGSGRAVVAEAGFTNWAGWYVERPDVTGNLELAGLSVLVSNGWMDDREEDDRAMAEELGDEGGVALRLGGRDLRDVVKLLAELTGKAVLAAPQMRGEVHAYVTGRVTRGEALKILYAVLETHGYTVIDYGTYMKIVRSAEAAGKPIRLQRRGALASSEEER